MIDLHTHSVHSDGTFTPTEIVIAAKEAGLSAVALTDHNTVTGLPEFLEAGKKYGIETVPGIEISCDYGEKEIHIVGLFIREAYYKRIMDFLKPLYINKEKSNIDLIKRLNDGGYRISLEEIKGKTPHGMVNRANIAAELFEKKYVGSVKEAFDTVLHKNNGFYFPPERMDVFETIEFLKEIRAVAVFAHPFLNLKTEAEREEFLPVAREHGLDAMEVMYSKYSEETEQKAMETASKFGLLKSGGSDFHGKNKPDINIGTGRGNLAVPLEYLIKMKELL